MTSIREVALREGIALELDAWAGRIEAGLEPGRRRPGNAALVAIEKLAADSLSLIEIRLGSVEIYLGDVAWARTHREDVDVQWFKLVGSLRSAAEGLRMVDEHPNGGK